MTKIIFFDNDCLSSFLWIKQEHLLDLAFPGRLQIPRSVYKELSRVPHLKTQVDRMVSSSMIEIIDIMSDSPEYKIYKELTRGKVLDKPRIGRGEAAAIALAKQNNGILASNNLKDISFFIKEYSLEYLTTGEIMINMVNKKIITDVEAEKMWTGMLNKRRMLPTITFHEYHLRRNDFTPR